MWTRFRKGTFGTLARYSNYYKRPPSVTHSLTTTAPQSSTLWEPGRHTLIHLLERDRPLHEVLKETRVSKKFDLYLGSNILRKEQAGFRENRSTIDQVFTLRNILEQANGWNAIMYTHFVDFEKAFDSVHREVLWNIMSMYGIPEELIILVKMMYNLQLWTRSPEWRWNNGMVIIPVRSEARMRDVGFPIFTCNWPGHEQGYRG